MIEIKKLLTITIPAYNVEQYIERCLKSILRSEKCRKYVEILVVNDGSTDSTKQIVEKYVEQYQGTIFLINKKNGGHGSTINRGVKDANGLFFMVVDGDDWIETSALEKLLDAIELYQDSKLDLISYHYKRVDMVTGDSVKVEQYSVKYDEIMAFKEIPLEKVYFALASMCYRTEILQKMELTLQENTYYVDVEYILLPIPHVENVLFLNIYLYKYFVGNIQQSIYLPTMVARYDHHNRVVHRILEEISSIDLDEWHKKYIYSIIEKVLYTHYALTIIYNENKEEGMELAKNFDGYLKKINIELYEKVKKDLYLLPLYRKFDFNYKRVQKAYLLKKYIYGVYIIKKISGKIRRKLRYV